MEADTQRLQAAWHLLERWHLENHCRAVSAETGAAAGKPHSFSMGERGDDGNSSVTEDSLFLIASPTKPVVATAAMMLVERGLLQIDHLVQKYLPDFNGGGKEKVRILHLLTHTSGLPDMLPNNIELRKTHAPLEQYMKCVCQTELVAPPGTKVSYQSMGLLTLAFVMERILTESVSAFLSREVFQPLGMDDTALGIPDAWLESSQMERMTWSQVDDQEGATEWGWNSMYWRRLGAPWGGLLSTASDLGRFCRHLLGVHQGESGILARHTLERMTSNCLPLIPRLPAEQIRTLPWGLGWQLNWPGHPRGFGSLLPDAVYGHWGATGTMLWIDPTRLAYGVVLTTEPVGMEDRRQISFGNLTSLVWR